MYRLCRDKKGQPHTLFHGVQGRCQLDLDIWIRADQKRVRDGSGRTWYRSGFHVMPDMPSLDKLAKRFKNKEDLVVVEVEVFGEVWPKSHSPYNVLLTEMIKISTEAWENRIPLAGMV